MFSMIKVNLCWSPVLLFLLLPVSQYASGQETCSVIGADREKLDTRRFERFYLNAGDSAGCAGNINSFTYCYYNPNVDAPSYLFNFAVYRERTPGGGEYYRVSPVFVAEKTRIEIENQLGFDDDEFTEFFGCVDYPLNESITIEAGDVLGACVFIPSGDSGIRELDIVGGKGSSQGMLMRTPPSDCGLNALPSNVTSLSASSNRVLHLHANITETNTNVATTIGSVVPVTTENEQSTTTNSGTFGSQTTVVQSESTADSRAVGAGTIVPIVVVILILLAVSVAVTVVIIVLWTRRQRHTQKSYPVDGVDNMLYRIAGDQQSAEYEEIIQTHNKLETQDQSQEHTYEFEGADSDTLNENTYTEVGPCNGEITEETNHYSSPLDATGISYAALLEKNKDEDIYGGENPYQVPAAGEGEIYFQLKSWGVQRVNVKDVEVVNHLASGQFGSVEQGLWKKHGTKPVDVALKSLNKECYEDKLKFLQEAAIMAQFRHPNVIMLYGVVTQSDPMMLVVEFAMKGDLRTFLLSMRPDPGELVPDNTSSMMLYFSQQVALGMQYLSAKGFVHRDLAARNVLVSSENICKVAEFGMSRDLADENYYISNGGMVPVKWTAPEAIHYKKYSTASDVWAYGCLLYEIWSVGYKPFEGVPNINALRLVDSGKRLSPPPGSPRMIYELMILCWHPDTSLRPAFRDIVLTLVGSEQIVFNIPEEDSSSNPLAGVLGAPLEAGENMYTDLQKRYDNT